MNSEQYRDYYFNYLAGEILKALAKSDRYKCLDFELVRLDLIADLNVILDNRQNFNKRIKVLSLNKRSIYEE